MVRKRRSSTNGEMSSEASSKPKRKRKRKKVDEELSDEEKELLAKQKRALNRKGVWEVTLDDGIVLGLFEGTPQRIGAYVAAQQELPPAGLYFQLTRIRQVPAEIARERCCERRFQRKDKFCPLCGKARFVQPTIPKKIKVDIDIGDN